MKKLYFTIALLFSIGLLPQSLFAQNPPAYALDNVIIHHSDGSVTESGTIVWRDGVIQAAGSRITIPFDAYTIDGGDSLHVYPGFVDGMGTWGAPDLPDRPERVDDPGNPGYDRAGIQPDRSASGHIDVSGETITDVMKLGITTANIGLKGYMFPGQTDLFFLNGEETLDHLFEESTGYQFAIEGAPGGWSARAYPSTTMGVMARFRQLMYDAEALMDHIDYFAAADGAISAPKRDRVLESLFPVLEGEKPLFANIDTPDNFERLMILKEEFGFDVIVVSGKSLYSKADQLAGMGIPVLASIDLPEKPEWMKVEEGDDEEGEKISEEQARFRERQAEAYRAAAENIRTLLDAGVKVGFASAGLTAGDFHEAVRNLRDEGNLSESEILKIFTRNTAEILGVDSASGDLQSDRVASFAVFEAPFFEEEAKVQMVISNGVIHEF